jgi:TonB family protein
MSIDEFRRKNRSAQPVNPVRSPSAAPTAPRVSDEFSFPAASRPATSTGEAVDLSFASGLLRDLRDAFDGSVAEAWKLSAEVEFSVGPHGSLVDVRVLRSSGVVSFDAAVLAAFKKVRARDFQPGASRERYLVTFRTTNE